MLIPAPDTAILENVSAAFPLFVSFTVWEPLFPTTTLENATLVGEAET